MKGIFPQYEQCTPERIAFAWKTGLFVFDTNVLLNLYRYQVTSRDELINVLGQLSSRIWIPHHVALEFQRNRLKVIAEQSKRFTDVRKTVEKARLSLFGELDKLQLQKRHSLIDPQPLTGGFDTLASAFLAQLEKLRQNQQGLTDVDPLKEKIEDLFDGRVGEAPANQESINIIYSDAVQRFKVGMPPGYEDSNKDKHEIDEHFHAGIIYKRKFGDYLVWRQITAHSKEHGIKHLILVTDDGKDDWWYRIDAEGPKTIGPRPELIEDARVNGSIDTFLMYSTEGFLKYAREFLKAPVSEETLKEVRDVSVTRRRVPNEYRELREFGMRAERAVYKWLVPRFESVEENRTGFPDFVATRDGKRFGFEVRVVQRPQVILHRMRESLYRGFYETERNGFAEITIILIIADVAEASEVKQLSSRIFRDKMPARVRLVIGSFIDEGRPDAGVFTPLEEVRLDGADT